MTVGQQLRRCSSGTVGWYDSGTVRLYGNERVGRYDSNYRLYGSETVYDSAWDNKTVGQ